MSNRLADETSPYLLQHADNPVDWHPWGDQAFRLAREKGKPVLLSIGYSACHWCHVMAHESFEDDATAALMNELFINIKVDREERPDIDKIYQTAHQLLTQRGGGWPLTMFLSADDQTPFFGGTYFPREARYGMPAFAELLHSVADFYRKQPDDVREQGSRLTEVLGRLDPPAAETGTALNAEPLADLRKRLAETFDRDYGGFAAAPKFPHAGTIERLLRHWRSTANDAEPDIEALFMASLTLTRMAEGGLYDHLGGGFCRYSVDRFWEIPHFEKMLYDNGPLLAAYAQAHLATGEPLFRDAALGTAGWMLADMRSDNGGFFSSRDADSEGEEGRFYVWTPEQVAELLSESDAAVVCRRFGLDQPANFEGQWHLTVKASIDDVARTLSIDKDEVESALERAVPVLLNERSRRVPPGRDDKQLTSWNALAIRGLAVAGRLLDRPDFVDAADRAARFLRETLLVDGRLMASYKDGRARFNAYLDDHAFLIDALLECLQSRWDNDHLAFACQLADRMIEQFEDPDKGGFFFTSHDHETLIHRARPFADDAMPSGNGVAALALQRLGHLTGVLRYNDAAQRTLQAAWRAISDFPHGHVTLITALEESLQPPELIVLRGDKQEAERWRDSAMKIYSPSRLIFAIDRNETALPGLLAERQAVTGETVAYRCVGTHCELPVTSWEALAVQLRESGEEQA